MFDYVCREKLTGTDALSVLRDQVPQAGDIEVMAPLYWADHCLECSPPACYASCELFEANEIGRCRRVDYMQLGQVPGLDFPAAHLRFRKWSKLRCPYTGGTALTAEAFLTRARRHESRLAVTRALDTLSLPASRKFRYPLSRAIHHRYILHFWPVNEPTHPAQELCLAFYAPVGGGRLILDANDFDEMLLTRHVHEVREGLNLWRIPAGELTRDDRPILALELYPADNAAMELCILFSDLVTFRADSKFHRQPAKKVKCVAWDLDNTLWDGILGEDGLDGVTLRPQTAEVIRALDRRGILNTICSKNDEAPALAALEKFGLREYFLYPRINWLPKSGNLTEISRLLNIGLDTFAFVDDSAFERGEVAHALGCVRVYADSEAESLLTRPEFDVPVTEDSRKRRAFYMAEARRQDAFTGTGGGDYESFIRSCGMTVDVARCETEEDLARCHELLMRTNQLNASTNRIPAEQFRALAADPVKTVLRIKCADRFGEYGTVGCLILAPGGGTLLCTDFVISCRVAKKKVESAILMFLMQKYEKNLELVYRPSERNHVLKDEFLSIGAQYDAEKGLMRFQPDTLRDYDWVSVQEGGAQ